jgi:hypothetical protein
LAAPPALELGQIGIFRDTDWPGKYLWQTCRMKKPFLRVTKWLKDIPVEGTCIACADSQFRANSVSHRPTREEYQRLLQLEFDRHVKAVHGGQADGEL